jgi:hypothetical protein
MDHLDLQRCKDYVYELRSEIVRLEILQQKEINQTNFLRRQQEIQQNEAECNEIWDFVLETEIQLESQMRINVAERVIRELFQYVLVPLNSKYIDFDGEGITPLSLPIEW